MCRAPSIDLYPVVKWCHARGEGAKSDWGRLFHGNVMRAFVRLRPVKKEVELEPTTGLQETFPPSFVEYRITGVKDSKTVGWLRLPSTSHDNWKALMGDDTLCECIVISECKAYGDWWKRGRRDSCFPEWNQIAETKDLGEYEYYNVLWIEWREGIAYRKMIGRVWKGGWHQLDVETKDIVLG